MSISTSGTVVEGKDIKGAVGIEASYVKLKNDCVEFSGGGNSSSTAVNIRSPGTGDVIEGVTMRGLNETTESIGTAVINFSAAQWGAGEPVVNNSKVENMGNALEYGFKSEGDYFIANGQKIADENGSEHSEIWSDGNDEMTAIHDTMFNPSKQTAVIFEQTHGACDINERVENSFLAGGGLVAYWCVHSTGSGPGAVVYRNDRIGRRVCSGLVVTNYQGRGGVGCSPEQPGYFYYGEGTGAYFPLGGFFGLLLEGAIPYEGIRAVKSTWEGNYWDDNLAPVRESATGG
jgi:hypothetical protein